MIDMYVRIKKMSGKHGVLQYATLLESEWDPLRKKRIQKKVAHLGNVAYLPINGRIEDIVVTLDRFARDVGITTLSQGLVIEDITTEDILQKTYGFGELLLTRQCMHILSLKILSDMAYESYHTDHDKKVSMEKYQAAIESAIAARLRPRTDISERETNRWYKEDVFYPQKVSLTLDDYYRSLDILIAQKDAIEQGYFESNRNLFSEPLELVLFDTTSIYYYGWTNPPEQNDLLQYGYSKDGKKDLKQVIVGVLMTGEGVPIAHEVFPGNNSDLKSFRTIVKTIQAKYHIERVILVGDRGMISEGNLKVLDEEGLEYIVGVRMRRLSPILKDLLLGREKEDMEQAYENLYTYDLKISSLHGEIQNELMNHLYKNVTAVQGEDEDHLRQRLLTRRYVVCYNPAVATDSKKKREYFRAIIKKKIITTTDKEWLVKNGYKKYVQIKKLEIKLNEKKLDEEEQYDGIWILMTNVKGDTISAGTLSTFYKTLQFVERGFRDLKNLITVQPIFHFKEERIKAHIFVCFLALIIKWYICHTLDTTSQIPGRRFIEQVLKLKAIAVDPHIPLYIRTSIDEETIHQMKKLQMKIPDKVIVDGRRKTAPPRKAGRPKKELQNNPLPLESEKKT